ncbi:hypothetical protein [Streptomyces sp. AM8-1-1]|nr:hypothetical protein [Streptomyces sp. AM8-1-1]WNO70733.1 hypothetical protein RPQ07_03430 [Streptomyces sp. AM8-1-1]
MSAARTAVPAGSRMTGDASPGAMEPDHECCAERGAGPDRVVAGSP